MKQIKVVIVINSNSNNNKNMTLVFPSQELKYFRQIEKYILEYRNNSKSNLQQKII